MSWRDSLSEAEKDGVEELKRRIIQDCSPKMLEDDSLFYRFMKARDFNLKNAEDMLKKHIAWRREYQIDTIQDYKPNQVIVTYSSVNFLGFDKDGDVVIYIDFGRSDPKGLVSSVKKIDLFKYNLQIFEEYLERMQQHSIKIGKPASKLVFISDFDDFSFAKATNKKALEYLSEAAKMYQDNYPERIKYMFVINASIYSTIMFSVIKPFLSTALLEKFRLFGVDGWKEVLLEKIDADVLPAFLGGNRTDPDGNPNCLTFIKYGQEVPKKYYLRKSERKFSLDPGVKKLTVTPFAKSEIRFDVKKPNSLLEWEFETKSRDIGFGVYFQAEVSDQTKPVELVPFQRIETCFEPETGMYRCEKAGSYIIVFDNSYSWIRKKDIYYRARIRYPNDEEHCQ